jgi:hypothetical protein
LTGITAVTTLTPAGGDRRHLGVTGHVSGLTYSTTFPGGDDLMTCLYDAPRQPRPAAIEPGRTVRLDRAGGRIWEGRLDQPEPAAGGWQVSAHGRGTYAALYRNYYTGTYDADGPVDAAITRGLPWTNPGLSGAGLDTSQPPDPASGTLADHLDAVCGKVTKAWTVSLRGELSTVALPTTPTRLLVLAEPPGRSLAGYVNRLYVRYLSGTDKYSTTSVVNQASIDRYGVTEDYVDFADAGVLTSSAAQSKASAILAQYQAAAWAGPFTVHHGSYLTMGQVEVDLACERAGEVVQIVFAGPAAVGEVAAGVPVTFIVGQAEYSQDDAALTLTPMATVYGNLADLMAKLGPRPKT